MCTPFVQLQPVVGVVVHGDEDVMVMRMMLI